MIADTMRLTWEAAKLALQAQQNMASQGTSWLVGVTVVLLGFTAFYNFVLNRREMRRIIRSSTDMLSLEVATAKKAIDALRTETGAEMKMMQAATESSIKKLEAEKARLFALVAESGKRWAASAMWWADAMRGFSGLPGFEGMVRVCAAGLGAALQKCSRFDIGEDRIIEAALPSVPKEPPSLRDGIAEQLSRIRALRNMPMGKRTSQPPKEGKPPKEKGNDEE